MRIFKYSRSLVNIMGQEPRLVIDLCEDETEFLIMSCLQQLGPLSSKNLLKILDTSKATLYRKIGTLVEKGYIEIDPVKTAQLKGKYYKNADRISDIFKNESKSEKEINKQLDKESKEDPQALVRKLRNAFNSMTTLNKNSFSL